MSPQVVVRVSEGRSFSTPTWAGVWDSKGRVPRRREYPVAEVSDSFLVRKFQSYTTSSLQILGPQPRLGRGPGLKPDGTFERTVEASSNPIGGSKDRGRLD